MTAMIGKPRIFNRDVYDFLKYLFRSTDPDDIERVKTIDPSLNDYLNFAESIGEPEKVIRAFQDHIILNTDIIRKMDMIDV